MITLPLTQVLMALLTISTRISGLMLFAPFFGSSGMPARVKPVLVLALTVLLYPLLARRMPTIKMSELPMIVFSELLIGAAIGVVINVVFEGIQMAGQILSVQMGYSLINILDPQTQVESTVVSMFHQTIAMLIFLRTDSHLLVLYTLAHSFDYLPVTRGHVSGALIMSIIKACGLIFVIGVQIAAPALAATLFVDLGLALLGKVAPQLPLMVLGPTVKTIPGILVLMATLQYWPTMFTKLFFSSIQTTDAMLRLSH